MSKNFGILGGDKRITELAKLLAKENKVYTEEIEKADIIIGPIPFSKDGIYVNLPNDNKINIEDVFKKLDNKIFIAGAIKLEVYELAKMRNIEIIDLMEREELTILNVIATVEGTIPIMIESTEKILQGSKVLILGFGRIGKLLAERLTGLACNVTCSARKVTDLAWIKTYGYEPTNINELGEKLSEYDFIINTAPSLILTKERIEYIKKDCVLIDLASNPGGIDKEAASEKNIKLIHALALPGKVAPVTSAEFIEETIDNILKEREN